MTTEQRDAAATDGVRLESWAERDLALLRLANSPEMMAHLGGPETEEQLLARHRRYLDIEGAGTGRMFSVVLLPEGETVGTIGYWDRVWQGGTVYEAGWGVLPRYQGRGIAVAAATAVIADAAARHTHASLHAYPSVDHPASNAICRKAGFTLVSACDFEYPPGNPIRCNDWRVDLTAADR
ncbi:GNAT family N-acetyltransferase [Streptomyces sp. H39-S7]|uniref:GNAT family N-acetyltransferase n=1 Tax=Streptomyces sp. H39-S7 TaxID=3004357 RepID=UPI0022B03853|nr:GNAT family N-acetyltransferase [Streptomyces sp. H39-S7]MCZ4123304.1 GNAT family N-acetyltransferase [Streptomyces sp. H39-S7]